MTLLDTLRQWYKRLALVDASPLGMPLNPDERSEAATLVRHGVAVLVLVDGKFYLQPASTGPEAQLATE